MNRRLTIISLVAVSVMVLASLSPIDEVSARFIVCDKPNFQVCWGTKSNDQIEGFSNRNLILALDGENWING
jgi:hypothetical protein